jgi:hypothetical protein
VGDLAVHGLENLDAVCRIRSVRFESVGRERRAAVRASCEDAASGRSQRPGSEELQDCRPAGEPGGDRRHFKFDIVAQERGQCGQVGVLVGGDVLLKQCRVDLVHHGSLKARPVFDADACASQCAVHGRGGHVEQRGYLGGGQSDGVAQQERGALARRQLLQGGDEREPCRLAAGHHVGRIGCEREIGDRLEPGHLGSPRRQRRGAVLQRVADSGRQHASLSAVGGR